MAPPLYTPTELTASGERQLQGYLLNRKAGGGCVFLDDATSLCTIHPTRPLLCRLFDGDGEDRDRLIQLGILRG